MTARRCVLAAIVAAGVLASSVSAAAPVGTGMVTGSVGAVAALPGPASKHDVTVRAIRAADLRVVAVRRLPANARTYSLRLPADVYVLVADGASLAGGAAKSSVSPLVQVKAGRSRNVPLGRRALAAAGSTMRLGVNPSMPIAGSGIPARALAPLAITGLANFPCPNGTRLEVDEIEHLQDVLKELALQKSPYVDPGTRVTPHLHQPTAMVDGGGSVSGGTLTLHLSVTQVASGKVTASASVSGPASSFFQLADQLIRKLALAACKPDEFPYRYQITNVQFHTHASGRITLADQVGICADTSGTRDFDGAMTAQPAGGKNELDSNGGSLTAWADAQWSNDVLHGCNITERGIEPCIYTAPPRKPQGGKWAVGFNISAPNGNSTIEGWWELPTAEIGFIDATPGCGLTPHISFSLLPEETTTTYPASDFLDPGPHTITYSGTHHFDAISVLEETLDFGWSVSVTFKRI